MWNRTISSSVATNWNTGRGSTPITFPVGSITAGGSLWLPKVVVGIFSAWATVPGAPLRRRTQRTSPSCPSSRRTQSPCPS